MLITKKVEIKTTNKNVGYYRDLGFKVESGGSITVDVSQLPKTSKLKVSVRCDNCPDINDITYFSYLRNIKEGGTYYCKKCVNLRFKETILSKYGVEHPLKLEEVKDRIRKTNIEKYGVEYPSQNEEIKNKSKESCLTNYGVDSFMKTDIFREKSKVTLIEKYGVDSPIKNPEIRKKIEKTNFSKYGSNHPFGSKEIRDKIFDIKKVRYGDGNFNNREKYKETCLQLFGVDNPMKNEDIHRKLTNIIFERYGVYHPVQYPLFFQKMLKSGLKIEEYKKSGIYYQGEYELDFLDKFFDKIEIKKHEQIKYSYGGEDFFYYPDFFIEKLNLIVEIKSSYWYEKKLDINLQKEKSCKEQGFNFIFIIDKDYRVFDKMVERLSYNKEHAWQYDIRLNTLQDDINNIDFDYTNLKIKDFKFECIIKDDVRTKDIVSFIKKYEWLGKMPNRPTHRFIATYNGMLAGVIIMSTPNSFSKILGEDTFKIEKLISRGACASWTPKNLASSLLMWSIHWMTQNTDFRVFGAYADTEAKELGTIYQACNFYYLGDNFGSTKLYFDPLNPNLGWISNRNFSKLNFYKAFLKKEGIVWNEDWNRKTTILWNKIPSDVVLLMKKHSSDTLNRCFVRKIELKHKYLYILGKDKRETKLLRRKFESENEIKEYPKIR